MACPCHLYVKELVRRVFQVDASDLLGLVIGNVLGVMCAQRCVVLIVCLVQMLIEFDLIYLIS